MRQLQQPTWHTKADADEGRRKGKSKTKLAFSSATSEYPPAVARETDATKMADATPVADASMVADEGRGKGTGEKRKSEKRKKADADEGRRKGKRKKRDASSLATSGERDAQHLAEVAETDAVLAAYKRGRSERQRRCQSADMGPAC